MRITGAELFALQLPFKKPFSHAAKTRVSSESVFLRLQAEDQSGFGETLPRTYVTGESFEGTVEALRRWLPQLLALEFRSLQEVIRFLEECDGAPPNRWPLAETRRTAAWAAVDLALLDLASRYFREPLPLGRYDTRSVHYAGAVLARTGLPFVVSLLKLRLYGFRDVKLKLVHPNELAVLGRIRTILGQRVSLRLDANMALTVKEALAALPLLARHNIAALEQPVAADDIEGMAEITRAAPCLIVADESLSDRESLERLIERRACSAVNLRIAKCGGLIALLRRAQEATQARLTLQIGCQVGESSLMSSAQLRALTMLPQVRFAEGCYGRHLLRDDPVENVLQFGYGGRAPALPDGLGHGVTIDRAQLLRHTIKQHAEQRPQKPLTAESALR